MESDADRLDIVQTLAGMTHDDVYVRHPGGAFAATNDREFLDVELGGGGPSVEGIRAVLRARTIDVRELAKDLTLEFTDDAGQRQTYRLARLESDAFGFTRLMLKR